MRHGLKNIQYNTLYNDLTNYTPDSEIVYVPVVKSTLVHVNISGNGPYFQIIYTNTHIYNGPAASVMQICTRHGQLYVYQHGSEYKRFQLRITTTVLTLKLVCGMLQENEEGDHALL
jgi:hypothetical protein